MADNFSFENLTPIESSIDQEDPKDIVNLELNPELDTEETDEEEVLENFDFSIDNLEPSTDVEKQKIRIFQDGIDREPDITTPGGFGIAADMIGGAAVGVGNAIEETYDGIQTVMGVDENTIKERNLIPEFYKPKTMAGQLTEGASRFLTGFIPANRVLKSVGWIAKPGSTTIANTFRVGSRGMAAGAIADFNVWDPHEGRLSDLLIEFDSEILNNSVTQYLASDPNDTLMEGRLKNVLEGMMIGTPLELLLGVRAIKKARQAKTIKEKNKIYKEHGEAIQESIEKNKEEPKATPDKKVFKYVSSLKDIETKAKQNNINLIVREEDNYIIVTRLEVDKANRSKGFGTEIMEDLINYADRNQLTIGAGYGQGSKMSIQRKFFKKFGFIDNRGTVNNDPNINSDIYRRPEGAKIDTDQNYRMSHQPLSPEDGAARLDDLTQTPDGVPAGYPDDFYSANGKEYYASYSDAAKESYDIIQSLKGKPDAVVTIYRAVPNKKNINTINPGDFVTLSKKYADDHAASGYGRNGDEPGKVISEKVKVHLF